MITRSLSALVLGAVVSGVLVAGAGVASAAPVTSLSSVAAPGPTCGVPLMAGANPDMICLTSPAS